jgi:hypothetical protein
MSCIVSVHQPNFLPWLGFFDKIKQSHRFVILDQVQVPRGKSVANRNKIKTAQGAHELVVPLSHPAGSQRLSSYLEVGFGDGKWLKTTEKTIEMAYKKAPFFAEIWPVVQGWLHAETFCEMNVACITEISQRLGFSTEIIRQQQITGLTGENNELILGICAKLGATTYLSGTGAAKYNDPVAYQNQGVDLAYQSFQHPDYPQLHGAFISHLSVIDALFNVGWKGTSLLLS